MNGSRSKRGWLAAVQGLDDESEDWRMHGQKSTELLPDYVFLCTLLSQFRLPQVRSDFAAGAFKLPRRSCGLSLLELDLLIEKLMPSWYGHDNLSIRDSLSHARALFSMIISQQAGTMQLSSSKSMPLRTFADWYKILNNIASCPYWKESQKLGQPGKLSSEPKPSSTVQTNTELVCTTDANVGVEGVMQNDACTSTEEGPDLPFGEPSCEMAEVSEGCDGVDRNNNVSFPLSNEPVYRQSSSQPLTNLANGIVNSPSLTVNSITRPVLTEIRVSRVGVNCSWCHRSGHRESACWRKRGLCLICGGQHRMTSCSQYVAPTSLAKPICSLCGGDHLGRNCVRVKRRNIHCHWCGRHGHLEKACCVKSGNIHCHWCGRHGHSEEACRVKSGACLICGSSSHVFSLCPAFVPRSVLPISPLRCIRCGSHHISAQCD